jgi:hypothetical protein
MSGNKIYYLYSKRFNCYVGKPNTKPGVIKQAISRMIKHAYPDTQEHKVEIIMDHEVHVFEQTEKVSAAIFHEKLGFVTPIDRLADRFK